MFRFLHAADIHLDSPLRGLEAYPDAPVDRIRGAVRRAFDKLIDIAIEEEVAFVLLAGDLYDGEWRDYNTGIYLMNRMGRLREAGIRAYIVSGNHDAASRITRALHLPDNVVLFSHKRAETRILEDLNVAIHGQSFASRAVSEDLARSYPRSEPGRFNIGLLHTAMTGRPGHEPYAPCTLECLIASGYQYWALGHVHAREEIARDPWVVFPGSIQGRHARETGPKGCTLVTVDEGRVSSAEHRDLDVLRWTVCRVDLTGCESGDACLEKTRLALEAELSAAGGRPVAARLILEGDTPLHAALHGNPFRWMEDFRGIAAGLVDVWLEKISFSTRETEDPGEIPPDDSPFSALDKGVEDLSSGSLRLIELLPEFEELRSKLPPELFDEEDLFNPSAEERDALCEEVKRLLSGRMLRKEDRRCGLNGSS